MLPMGFPVLRALGRQRFVPDDQHILRVLLLRRLGELETPREDGFAVDNNHLIVRDGMIGINRRGHPLVGQEVGRGVFFVALTLIQNHLHRHAALVGVEQCLGDGGGGEAVGLDENAGLGSPNGVDN
jgi:hypothetical protein